MVPISRSREVLVLALVAIAMLLTGIAVGLDAAAWPTIPTSKWPGVIDYSRSVVCAVIVLLIGGYGVGGWDKWMLSLAFAAMLGGDLCLELLELPLPGIAVFFVVHGVLIVRHMRGLKGELSSPRHDRTVRWLWLTALAVCGGTGLVLHLIWDLLAAKGTLTLDCIYIGLLATSLWSATSTLTRRTWPALNASFIFVGIACFYVCDVIVGVSLALAGTELGATLNLAVGFAYAPALLLLALSGFCWSAADAASIASKPQN